MIIVKITGGLGNQLFQYAIGRALSLHHQVPLKLDITAYENHKQHNGFRLDLFKLKFDVATKEEIYSLKGSDNYIYRALRKAGLLKKKTFFAEKQSSCFNSSIYTKNNVYLDGYWQNEKYFSNNRDLLLKELTPIVPMSLQASSYLALIQNCNAVSVHVRRGDYLNIQGIGVLGTDYYRKSVNYLLEHIESPKFFIFSNDYAWCKKNLSFINNVIYVEDTVSEIDDLQLMSQCKHSIVANSSFSWWGAWLNDNSDKIVIAPKGWRLDIPDSSDMILSSWVKF